MTYFLIHIHLHFHRSENNSRLSPFSLICQVPGVSENRPSVLRGDTLLVYPAGEKGVKYRGYVHSVELDSVKLGFSSKYGQDVTGIYNKQESKY